MTTVQVELPDETLRDLDDLAKKKGITRTEALIEAVTTTRELVERAPNGARIVPVGKVEAALSSVTSSVGAK